MVTARSHFPRRPRKLLRAPQMGAALGPPDIEH